MPLFARFYARVAPPHSFLHVHDFDNVEKLASELHRLKRNVTAYNEYFWWTRYYQAVALNNFKWKYKEIRRIVREMFPAFHRLPFSLGSSAFESFLPILPEDERGNARSHRRLRQDVVRPNAVPELQEDSQQSQEVDVRSNIRRNFYLDAAGFVGRLYLRQPPSLILLLMKLLNSLTTV